MLNPVTTRNRAMGTQFVHDNDLLETGRFGFVQSKWSFCSCSSSFTTFVVYLDSIKWLKCWASTFQSFPHCPFKIYPKGSIDPRAHLQLLIITFHWTKKNRLSRRTNKALNLIKLSLLSRPTTTTGEQTQWAVELPNFLFDEKMIKLLWRPTQALGFSFCLEATSPKTILFPVPNQISSLVFPFCVSGLALACTACMHSRAKRPKSSGPQLMEHLFLFWSLFLSSIWQVVWSSAIGTLLLLMMMTMFDQRDNKLRTLQTNGLRGPSHSNQTNKQSKQSFPLAQLMDQVYWIENIRSNWQFSEKWWNSNNQHWLAHTRNNRSQDMHPWELSRPVHRIPMATWAITASPLVTQVSVFDQWMQWTVRCWPVIHTGCINTQHHRHHRASDKELCQLVYSVHLLAQLLFGCRWSVDWLTMWLMMKIKCLFN